MGIKNYRLLVTPTSYGRHDMALITELEKLVGEVTFNTTGKPLSSQQVAEMLPGIDGYIAGLDFIDREALKAADKLKVIARYGVGMDRVDLDAAREKGIIVTNTPGANSQSVAELALALILSLARNIPYANQAVRDGEWPRLSGISLEEKIVGIIGFGAIGKQLAWLLAGFGCTILAYDPNVKAKDAKEAGAALVGLDELAGRSDFISLHTPLVAETKGLINEEFLSKMRKGSFIINTSRGGIINEDDLYVSLQSGHIRGAALDAFSEEPPPACHRLFSLPQVIATPHTGAHTDRATNNMGWIAMRECLAVLRGEEPLHRVV